MKIEKGVRITQQGHAATIWEDIHQLTKGLNMEFASVNFPGSLQINDKIHPQLTEITKQKEVLTCIEDMYDKCHDKVGARECYGLIGLLSSKTIGE